MYEIVGRFGNPPYNRIGNRLTIGLPNRPTQEGSEIMMRNRRLPIICGLLTLIFLAGCGGVQGDLESAAQEQISSAAAEAEFLSVEEVIPAATAVLMPVEEQGSTAGETEVLVEAPEISEPIRDQSPGQPDSEDGGGVAGGETFAAEGTGLDNIELNSKEGRIAFAQNNLAEKLGVGLEAVLIVGYENIIWPDGNLGCPQKGKRYTPAEIQGYIIRLRAGDQDYIYHGGAGRLPFECQENRAGDQFGREIIVPPPDLGP